MMRRFLLLAVALVWSAAALAADAPKIWNADRAMKDIENQVSFGPRSIDTPGHRKAIDYIKHELAKTRAQVEEQNWDYVSPDGKHHPQTNIIAHFDPGNARRVILGTHYDSIIRSYRDAENPQGYMPGANNSASGVALLLETARVLGHPPRGVDIIFFDGEEGPLSMGEGDMNWFPLGSPYFVEHFPKLYEKGKPEAAVIFDMVCYRDIKLKPELHSVADARDEVTKFWRAGMRIAPAIFSLENTRSPIYDDQLALNKAGIPSILVIGFEYDPWFNTTKDTIDKCSPQVLEGLGRTVLAYIYEAPETRPAGAKTAWYDAILNVFRAP